MPRFVVDRVTLDEADILVEGRVTLEFRYYNGTVYKVGATSSDRKSPLVSRKDFLDARELAKLEMSKKRNPHVVRKERDNGKKSGQLSLPLTLIR